MGKAQNRKLSVPQLAGIVQDGDGQAEQVGGWDPLSIQVTGSFTATLAIQGSLDGQNFTTLASPLDSISAPLGPVAVPAYLQQIRVQVSGASAGLPFVTVAGIKTSG